MRNGRHARQVHIIRFIDMQETGLAIPSLISN
jgi:hypothetical protein